MSNLKQQMGEADRRAAEALTDIVCMKDQLPTMKRLAVRIEVEDELRAAKASLKDSDRIFVGDKLHGRARA